MSESVYFMLDGGKVFGPMELEDAQALLVIARRPVSFKRDRPPRTLPRRTRPMPVDGADFINGDARIRRALEHKVSNNPADTRSNMRETLNQLKNHDSKLNQILRDPAKANPPTGGFPQR